MIKCHTQEVNITTNQKIKTNFTFSELSETKIVIWNCHKDASSKEIYFMTLGTYLLTALWLNIQLSEHVIQAADGSLKGLAANMVALGTYKLKKINAGYITPKESFINAYSEEIYE